MWNTLVSHLNRAMGELAFRFVDLFWAHAIAGFVLLASAFVIIAVLLAELLDAPPVQPRRDHLRPVSFRFKR